MALQINTNVAALSAHQNMVGNDKALSDSIEKLSSGLRINKAADDASGMAIADSLKSQAMGLGQAVKNANDGISMVQTADGALEESINIVNTIKTKSIQAAQDGQTSDSRKAIQSDIDKLMEELDVIAKTTAFNNQKLLSGEFSNKEIQIGAYSGETADISIGSAESTKMGHVATSDMDFDSTGTTSLSVYSSEEDKTYDLSTTELAYDNTRENSVGAVADQINKLSDKLGISATAEVESSSADNVSAGDTGSDFAINGVQIGQVQVQENDADGALVNAINNKVDQHGVEASVGSDGKITLTSTDDRAIQVNMDESTQDVFGASSSDAMDTLGSVRLNQEGAGEVVINNRNLDGTALDLSTDPLAIDGDTYTTQSSVLGDDSTLASGSTIAAGTELSIDATATTAAAISGTTGDSTIGDGSTLASGSVIAADTTLTGKAETGALSTTGDSTLGTETTLTDTTSLTEGSVFHTNDLSESDLASGADYTIDGDYITIGSSGADLANSVTLTTEEATLASGSDVGSGSVLGAGTTMADDVTLDADMTLTEGNMTLKAGSDILAGSKLASETELSDDFTTSGSITVDGSMTLEAGSTMADASELTNSSSIGGEVTLADDETVSSDGQMHLQAGSELASGSTITAGTELTNDVEAADGTTYEAGTTLESDITTQGTTDIDEAMTLEGGSELKSGSVLAANDRAEDEVASSKVGEAEVNRLADINVTSQEGAQKAMAVADAALKDLDSTRANLGSVQNQLSSTVANISTTKVNVEAAESNIRDVDFAEESGNFSKMQVLTQASSFAMSQANASSQNVLSLLQG